MTRDTSHDRLFMKEALAEAAEAEARGEVPVGAVAVEGSAIVARGRNAVIADSDPTAHAEIVALRGVGRARGNYRLEGITLYTTLEPCLMCFGAAVHARIDRLVYAAADPKAGALSAGLVARIDHLNHRFEVVAGVERERASALLEAFFRARRRAGRPPA